MPNIKCPNCSHGLNAPKDAVGRKIQCGDCEHKFILEDGMFSVVAAAPVIIVEDSPFPKEVQCPSCSKGLAAPEAALNKKIQCGSCEHKFILTNSIVALARQKETAKPTKGKKFAVNSSDEERISRAKKKKALPVFPVILFLLLAGGAYGVTKWFAANQKAMELAEKQNKEELERKLSAKTTESKEAAKKRREKEARLDALEAEYGELGS